MWPIVGTDKHSYLTEDGVSVGEKTARKWKDGWKVGWMDGRCRTECIESLLKIALGSQSSLSE